MDIINNFVNGMAFALGTVVVTTIAIYVGFKRGSKITEKILKWVMAAWGNIKDEGINGFSIKVKKEKKK